MSSLEEMETSGEDSMFFQDGLEVLEDGSTDDLIDAYVAPENYAQEGTPVREGKGGLPLLQMEVRFSAANIQDLAGMRIPRFIHGTMQEMTLFQE